MKYGLGKGLGALLSQYDSESDKKDSIHTQHEDATNELAISQIHPNPNQPRKHFDETALNELAESIKIHGLIQPIIVNKTDNGYMIIAGERRYRACQLAGLTTISVIIKNYTDRQVSEISIIENLQREDLSPVEVSRGIKKLMEEYDLTQEKVSERLGKSRSEVTNYIRILSLPAEITDMIEQGKVSFGHAKCLAGVSDYNTQLHLAKEVAKNKLTVRGLESEISKLRSNKSKINNPLVMSMEMGELIKLMQQKLGTKVNVIGNDNKGRIYIDYYEREDLNRIFELINKC